MLAELHEVQALLAAAKTHRPLIATMILAGLRVGELTALRWRDLDLASGKIRITDAKSDAASVIPLAWMEKLLTEIAGIVEMRKTWEAFK